MEAITHLRAFQALEAALRLGTLARAADALGVTPAAVGQRIKGLEDYLGFDLVVRGRSGLRATPELARAAPHLQKGFAELAAAARALDMQRPNEIHIAANSDWVNLWLAPRLPAFRAAYPNVRFCINGEGDAPMRIGPSDVEIAFRQPVDDANVDPLFFDYIVPICSAENHARVPRGRRAHPLEGLPLLHVDFYRDDPDAVDWPRWVEKFGRRKSGVTRGMRFQQVRDGLDAIKSSAGYMLAGLALLVDEMKDDDLRFVFSVHEGVPTGHVFQARFKAHAPVGGPIAQFRDWLSAQAAQTRASLIEDFGLPPESVKTDAARWRSAPARVKVAP